MKQPHLVKYTGEVLLMRVPDDTTLLDTLAGLGAAIQRDQSMAGKTLTLKGGCYRVKFVVSAEFEAIE